MTSAKIHEFALNTAKKDPVDSWEDSIQPKPADQALRVGQLIDPDILLANNLKLKIDGLTQQEAGQTAGKIALTAYQVAERISNSEDISIRAKGLAFMTSDYWTTHDLEKTIEDLNSLSG